MGHMLEVNDKRAMDTVKARVMQQIRFQFQQLIIITFSVIEKVKCRTFSICLNIKDFCFTTGLLHMFVLFHTNNVYVPEKAIDAPQKRKIKERLSQSIV